MNSKLKNRIKHLELQKKASELRLREDKNYTRNELIILAKVAGIHNLEKANKRCLALVLGIELPKKNSIKINKF